MQIVGVALSVWLIDTAGRRPLLIGGGSVAAGAMVLLTVADYFVNPVLVVIAMCLFIAAFSLSFAGVFWVLVSEIFSMSSKSPAASAATAMLFLAGAVANLVFLSLHQWLGPFSFLVFGAVAGAGAVYCYLNVPETRGKTLAEIQAMLGGDTQAASIIEVLPRVSSPQDGVRRSSLDTQALAHQHDHAQSHMESGLLSNSNAGRSSQLHSAGTEAQQTTDASMSFRDRIRLHWFNWSGYQRYQAERTVNA